MSDIWFTAMKKFDPSIGAIWTSFFDQANIPQLTEIISLDTTYRPQELLDLMDSDWKYNIHKDFLIALFWDLEYFLKRFADKMDEVNILAACLEPSCDVREIFKDNRFVFQGYDLVEKGGVSAITTYGRFGKVFQHNDISNVGLFESFSFAREVQKQLHQRCPFEHYADQLWAIWKMVS